MTQLVTEEIKGEILTMRQELAEVKHLMKALLTKQAAKEFYTTDEFGELVGLKAKTVRDYCDEGRLRGEKRNDGHGRTKRWTIPHAELLRYQREGLLPRRGRAA